MDVQKDLLEFIAKKIPGNSDILDVDLNLLESGMLDSVALMDLVFWAEDRFNLTFDIEDLVPDNFATINAISAFITKSMVQS